MEPADATALTSPAVRGRQAGLGKGLAAILPSEALSAPASPAEAALEPLLREVVDSGLEAAGAAVALDLCAYLHWPDGFGPQLYLRAPTLGQLDATAAFDLLGGLRDVAADAPPRVDPDVVAGFRVLPLHSHGEHSRGLHIVGRRHHALNDAERAVIVPLCRAVARAAHALESSMQRRPAGRGLVSVASPEPEGLGA